MENISLAHWEKWLCRRIIGHVIRFNINRLAYFGLAPILFSKPSQLCHNKTLFVKISGADSRLLQLSLWFDSREL